MHYDEKLHDLKEQKQKSSSTYTNIFTNVDDEISQMSSSVLESLISIK